MKIQEGLKAIELELGRRYKDAISDFIEILEQEVEKIGEKTIMSQPKLLRKTINRLVAKSGISKVYQGMDDLMGLIENLSLEQLKRDIGGQDLSLTDSQVSKLRRSVTRQGKKRSSELTRLISKSVRKDLTVSNLKKETINEIIESVEKVAASTAQTVSSTIVQGYDNTVITEKANDLGLSKFVYAGSGDSKNRQFCAERVGGTFTDEQASNWDNGQGLPAEDYLGGWNCRHRKRYLTT